MTDGGPNAGLAERSRGRPATKTGKHLVRLTAQYLSIHSAEGLRAVIRSERISHRADMQQADQLDLTPMCEAPRRDDSPQGAAPPKY